MSPVDHHELEALRGLWITWDQLRGVRLAEGAHWILPDNVLPGVERAYGLPIVRADVPEPMIGIPRQDAA